MFKEFIIISFFTKDVYGDLEKRISLEFFSKGIFKKVNFESFVNNNYMLPKQVIFDTVERCLAYEIPNSSKEQLKLSERIKEKYPTLHNDDINVYTVESESFEDNIYQIGSFIYLYNENMVITNCAGFVTPNLSGEWFENFPKIKRKNIYKHFNQLMMFVTTERIPKFLFDDMIQNYFTTLQHHYPKMLEKFYLTVEKYEDFVFNDLMHGGE